MNNNKYDNLILPKLYLSKFFKFYKTLEIPEDIKAILNDYARRKARKAR